MIRRPPRSTPLYSSAASDVYKRQVKDRRLLSTGYNGVPSGVTHCEVVGCLRERLKVPSGERHELCRGLHAEQNAIIQAAYHGVSIQGAHLYLSLIHI